MTVEAAALAEVVLGWADDELVLAHLNSEWTGHGPILEEDIALTNIALDEMGHAQILYGIHSELIQADAETYPDHLVFFREAPEFRNAQIWELPRGDWGFSILRQYLHDELENVRLKALVDSKHLPLAQAAAKIATEELYHLRFSRARVMRLAQGTEESKRRMQDALDRLWPYTPQLFLDDTPDPILAMGWIPDPKALEASWEERVLSLLAELGLDIPEIERHVPGREEHSEHLVSLLDELQRVARAYPGASW
ncbi:MAG: 1,2-phenylacetyl-CoA epoxidase subunit PaaC [Planctomycetota bacterium]|jgi:ring-1,2-phenylacetyl-CoA epoxidase subunit PaaC